jgi:hypothetical protein
MNNANNGQQFLSRRQVAERWGVHPITIQRRKDLKPIRFNCRLLRYRLSDVLACEAAKEFNGVH